MVKVIFLNHIILVLTIGLIPASESIASDPLQTRFEQLLRSVLLQSTDPRDDLQETGLAQNPPLEHVQWPLVQWPWPITMTGPYCSAGRLMLEEEIGCTAFMISKNHALTAKHCVLERKKQNRIASKRPNDELTLCLGRSCNRTAGTCLNVDKVRTSAEADYALITYKEDYWCTHTLRYSDSWDGQQVELFGYPNRPWPTDINCRFDPLYRSLCSDTKGPFEYSKKIYYYNCETQDGMSGSPMSLPWESGVYGVHSKNENGIGKAVLITKDRYCDIASCINRDYGNNNFGGSTCSRRQRCPLKLHYN